MKPLVIIGSGGQAREVAWLIEENNKKSPEWELLGFVSKEENNICKRYEILGDDSWFDEQNDPVWVVCAVGNPILRERIVRRISNYEHVHFATVISRNAICSDTSIIGEGTVVCAGCILTTDVKLGRFVICNPGAIISHDSVMEDYVTINAGVRISGNVTVRNSVYMGVNSCTIQGVTIGERAIIGAGATVIDNIPDNCTAVGVPARVIR